MILPAALIALLCASTRAHPGKTGADGCHRDRSAGKVHCHGAAEKKAESFEGKVVGVMDGDTLEVMRGGKARRVRLWGVDCPEKSQAFGSAAKKEASGLVFGRLVTVVVKDQDRYGRLVAEVRLPDGRSLNEELLRGGHAWWYRRYAPDEKRFAALEREAREGRLGLWSEATPLAPWSFRAERRGSGAASF